MKASNNYYLFRHALATKSKHGYGKRILTADILPEGLQSIRKLALYLKNIPDSINFSSEIKRCKQSAKIISDITQADFRFDYRLNEFYRETFTSFKKRVETFLDSISKYKHKNIIILTHGKVIAAIKHFIQENKFREKDRLDYPKEGELLIIKDKEIKTISFNS